MKASVENAITTVIYESFILPADEDYVTARLLAANGLSRAFYWSAAQAFEKYLKAFLISHGQSVIPPQKGNKHAIADLYKRASVIEPDLDKVDLAPKADLSRYSGITGDARTKNLLEFVQEIEENGNPNNRYNASGVKYFSIYVHALDSALAYIRSKLTSTPIEENIADISDDLKRAFYFQNEHFKNSAYPSKLELYSQLGPIWSTQVTRLEFIKKNQDRGESAHALNWLKQRMWI